MSRTDLRIEFSRGTYQLVGEMTLDRGAKSMAEVVNACVSHGAWLDGQLRQGHLLAIIQPGRVRRRLSLFGYTLFTLKDPDIVRVIEVEHAGNLQRDGRPALPPPPTRPYYGLQDVEVL